MRYYAQSRLGDALHRHLLRGLVGTMNPDQANMAPPQPRLEMATQQYRRKYFSPNS
jgi:hypothetical protein